MCPFEDRFERAYRAPLYWRNCSTDLLGSAAAVWAAIDSNIGDNIVAKCDLGQGFDLSIAGRPVYEMLCGMSLELLYKAIAVVRRKDIRHQHNLVKLSEHVGIELDSQEQGLLKILTEAIVWSGRYPIPKRRDQWEGTISLREKHLFKKTPSSGLAILSPNEDLHWDSFHKLWRKSDQVFLEHYDNFYSTQEV